LFQHVPKVYPINPWYFVATPAINKNLQNRPKKYGYIHRRSLTGARKIIGFERSIKTGLCFYIRNVAYQLKFGTHYGTQNVFPPTIFTPTLQR
jgi:hypothetical protein